MLLDDHGYNVAVERGRWVCWPRGRGRELSELNRQRTAGWANEKASGEAASKRGGEWAGRKGRREVREPLSIACQLAEADSIFTKIQAPPFFHADPSGTLQ